MGGPLDGRLLEHLAVAATSRTARFELRGLVMRDPVTVKLAPPYGADDFLPPDDEYTGLHWLRSHAHEFPDPLEVMRDAVQYATEPAWFTLRVLTSYGHERWGEVRDWLEQFAASANWTPS